MKKDLLALVSVPLLMAGLAGYVTAQQPAALPTGEVMEVSEAAVVPTQAPGTVAVPADCGAPCGHCQPMKKVCQPAPGKKTTTHVVYGHKCVDICLPGCGGGSCKLFGKRNDCGCPDSCDTDCGKPREVRKLVKK